ncbi:MAG: PQQ-binding-like beta-propeller repeat protein [Phycisphaerae bacterium]|nr:PQQ-binding-like beta-propeller repeat protein [Phycisphaerae bacterium]
MKQRIIRWVFVACMLTIAAIAEAQSAKSPLEAAGIQGGVIVHLGCGDGRLTASLRLNDGYCVHGLDADPKNVDKARRYVQAKGLYGGVSIDTFDGRNLPYVDNMVNLLVADGLGKVSQTEVMRVLAPGGVALINGRKRVKSRPDNIDEWTHYLHDADNNAVANDTVVGPPRRLQWQGGPKWTRHHDHMSSFSAMVSTGGRLFYIVDEGSTASIYMPSCWALIARDAFNGKVLWKRKIDTWYTRFKGLKDGPADAPRRLVAADSLVYTTLSLEGPVTSLDAATGETVRTYQDTAGAEEILLSRGELFVLIGSGSIGDGGRTVRPVETRTIMALDAAAGNRLWQKSDVVAAGTIAVDNEHVYYFNFDSKKATCLERKNGEKAWTSEPLPSPDKQMSFFSSRLVVRDGVVLFAGGEFSGMTKSGGGETRADTLTALSAETGKTLWTGKHLPSGYSSPENLFVIDGIVWCDSSSNGKLDGTVVGMDLKTGKVKHRFGADKTNYWFHHRCYPGRATTDYIMTSRTGIEFVDLDRQHWDLNHWVRGACLYGILPCNGLVYTPPSPCICYAESMLHSFNAFAPASPGGVLKADSPRTRLKKGPAYNQTENRKHVLSAAEGSQIENPNDWPTYRHDTARSGATKTTVPARLNQAWQTPIAGKLSSVTVADGKVFVAAVDQHTVHTLAADSGTPLWDYTTGGRVDSAPTYFEGRILFGSADGYVYCLRADDGALLWRFLAAPTDRRIIVYEQVESLWPVHGSVLVRDGIAHFVAGRSIFVDGGMRLYRLDARSGEMISETALDDRDPRTGGDVQELVKWLNMPVGRPDILSCDEKRIYMRSQAFDFQGKRLEMGPEIQGPQEGTRQGGDATHLFCPTGFLDDTWFHRTYWLYGKTWGSGWNGYYIAGKHAPAGKIMSVGDDKVYVFGRRAQYYKWTRPLEYRLFAADKQWKASAAKPAPKPQPRDNRRRKNEGPVPVGNAENYRWSDEVPVLVRAMTLAGKTLFIAGPEDVLQEEGTAKGKEDQILKQEAALLGKDGAVLWAVSAEDGAKLCEYKLASPPVFDGMAAANGRLYLATRDGRVSCFD